MVADGVASMPPVLRDLVTSEYALVVLFVVFVLEGAMLMYFMPSELVVPGALALVGTSGGRIAAVLAVAVCGATLGQYALFRLARDAGRERLLASRWFRVSDERLARFERWFDRWGPVVVPVSNALPFTRGMLTVPAGFADLDDRRFVVLSALGTLVFEATLAGLFLLADPLL